MNPGMAGDDAALDSHVAAIAAKLRGGTDEPIDKRENREDRDVTDVQSSDLEESERLEREANQQDGESQAEAETESAEKAEDEADAFIELPAAEEGGEPERIPVTEAAEAVKQLRQMNGDIATAVIKAEEDAFAKQDQVTQAITQTLQQVDQHAKATLEMMRLYAPQQPHPDDFMTTEDYYKAKLHFEAYAQHYNKVLGTIEQSGKAQNAVGAHQVTEYERREIERSSRFIPEFKDEKTRASRKSEILETMGKHFGVTKSELDEIVDHKAWRMMDKLDKALRAEKKAPEVKKHLQETKPKIVNGRVSPERDRGTGQFINKARKEHAEKGNEDTFARLLLRSGALKNL